MKLTRLARLDFAWVGLKSWCAVSAWFSSAKTTAALALPLSLRNGQSTFSICLFFGFQFLEE